MTEIVDGAGPRAKVLLINPNSSKAMTGGLDTLVKSMGYDPHSTKITTWTAPSGPNSINNESDALASAKICIEALSPVLAANTYNAFIVACFSHHPLVGMLRTHPSFPRAGVAVGIFESAISSALTLLPFPHELTKSSSGGETEGKFGIVTTGAPWIPVLTASTNQYLGLPATEEKSESSKFSGVESTGLNADELHTAPPEEVHRRMVDATRRLVRGGHTKVIILGCAGMAGMDDMVKEGCEAELGREGAKGVRIVDGVKAALAVVDGFVRSQS